MSFVSLADFQNYVGQQRGAMEQMQQSINRLTGDLAVGITQMATRLDQTIEACDARMTAIEVRGSQLFSDPQVSQNCKSDAHCFLYI